jgi:SEC-C motif
LGHPGQPQQYRVRAQGVRDRLPLSATYQGAFSRTAEATEAVPAVYPGAHRHPRLNVTRKPLRSILPRSPSMLTEIKTPGGSQYAFTFPSGSESRELAGKQYRLGFGFCDNPACRCGVVSVRLFPDEPGTASEYTETRIPLFEMNVDVLKQKLDTGLQKRSVSEKNIGATFVRALSGRDWRLLTEIFYYHKRRVTDETPDEKIDAPFPADDIEQHSAMVSFHGILPYAEAKIVDIEDRRFQLDELYCVKSGCTCTDVAVGLLDFSALHDAHDRTLESPIPALFLNYHTKAWRIENAGEEDPQLLNHIAETLNTDAYASLFQRHHARLKSLYRGYQARHPHHAAAISTRQPVGRNDRCPCGSGKKYKKCCLNAPMASWRA